MDFLRELLPWIIPAVVGAAIGYITNDIAIRMLFRPLKEYRILGIKVPFTPGIIPKQRRQLAESIGDMVSNQLITAEAVRSQLAQPRVRESIKSQIASLAQGLLAIPLAHVATKDIPVLQQRLPALLESVLGSFFQGRAFTEVARTVILHFMEHIAGRPLGELMSEINLENALAEKLSTLVKDPGFREKLQQVLADWIHAHVQDNSAMAVLINDEMSSLAAEAFRAILPLLEKALVGWLSRPDVKTNLQVKGKLLLDEILAKLNLIQRFFISVGQYDKTLGDKMPEIIDSLIVYLEQLFESEENRETIVAAFGKALSDFKKKKLKNLLKEQSIDPDAKIAELVPSFLDFLDRADIGAKLASGVTMFLVKNSSETVGEALVRIFGLTPAQAADYVAGLLFEKRFAENAATLITGFVVDFLKNREEQTIGEFFGITPEKSEEFVAKAYQSLAGVLESKIPEAIQSLDVKSMVVDKINALDVASVENLLLMVIAKHLKWINIFGAILGALIGLIQSVIDIFM